MSNDSETEKHVKIMLKQLTVSTDFKRSWLEDVRRYEEAYYLKEKKTFRVQYNLPLPVMSGMVDELKDNFDDELAMRFSSEHPADKLRIAKFQPLFDREANSLRANAMWDYKTRADKFLAILSGRGIQKTFAQSDPEFMLNFEVVDYRFFHCEPRGGGILSRHLFKGEEGIFKTRKQLIDGARFGFYDKKAVKAILMSESDRKEDDDGVYEEKLTRFQAMGFDGLNHNYVGDSVFHFCEWFPTIDGVVRHMIVDPRTKQAIRDVPLKEDFESGLDPYTSWATHEDPVLFWGKSYSKDFYICHEAVRDDISDVFSIRKKSHLTPKFFDAELVDAARLDKSQYENDTIVPINTKGGTRKISEAVYQFPVKELGTATVDVSNWLMENFRAWTGTKDLSDQANNSKVAANVVYSKLQSASKRLSHRAKSFREAYAGAGLRAWHGAAEHFSGEASVRVLGPKGYGIELLRHEDFKLEAPEQFDPTVVSKSEEDELNVMGKDQKKKWLETVIGSEILMQQYNPKKVAELGARDLAGFKDDDVEALLDVNEFQAASLSNKADIAILQLCKGKMPDLVYDADTGFLERIMQFEKDHRNQLDKKLELNQAGEIAIFYKYLIAHATIVASNMGKIANQILMNRAVNPQNPNQNQNNQKSPAPGTPPRAAPPGPGMAGGQSGMQLNVLGGAGQNGNQYSPAAG